MSSTNLWHIPTWAAQTMFDHDSGTAVHYSAESDPLAYASATTYLTAEGMPEEPPGPAAPPVLIVRVGDSDAVLLEPNNGDDVRKLARALLDCAHVWDEEHAS